MESSSKKKYVSLQEFLRCSPLSVDAVVDYGGGLSFPVKGREIDASILFADMSNFSARTVDLLPTETLLFANDFFAWMTGPIVGRHGIVDKYIGDAIMVVFSDEFGSEDAFTDALQTARFMIENDVCAFVPHIGIASGLVTVGYVGTSFSYGCSVFGTPATLAARCATNKSFSVAPARIVFPAREWKYSSLNDALSIPRTSGELGPGVDDEDIGWRLHETRNAELRNLGAVELRCIERTRHRLMTPTAEDRAKTRLEQLGAKGAYSPRAAFGSDSHAST